MGKPGKAPRKFTPEFKAAAVQRLRDELVRGRTQSDVARALGVTAGHAETLEVVERARFASAFTFQYSKRPGTPAAELADQVPKEVVSERYRRLIELQERISLEENTAQIGRTVELLVATGEGRKDATTARMSGRARDGRLVHFDPRGLQIRAGDVVTTTVTDAAPHHLIADSEIDNHRRTRAGDAHAAGQRPRTGVGLGMPGIGAPAVPTPSGCSR